jgi:hypothetical protein
LCIGCAAETLYYSSNSNNNTRPSLRTNTHTFISTLGEKLFHQYYVTSKPYPLLPEIVSTNSYTRAEYKTLLIDHNVPYACPTDDFDAYIARHLPILSKWTRIADTNSVTSNPVTITHVLLTSSTSDNPTDCDYTVFFSNDNVLLAQTQRKKRSSNQQSKKKLKTSHTTSNSNNKITSPTMTQTTIQPSTPTKPSRVTRQSTATLTPSSSSSHKSSSPPTKPTKHNPKTTKSTLHQQHKSLIGRQFLKWFEGQEVSPGKYVQRGIFQATISEIHDYFHLIYHEDKDEEDLNFNQLCLSPFDTLTSSNNTKIPTHIRLWIHTTQIYASDQQRMKSLLAFHMQHYL